MNQQATKDVDPVDNKAMYKSESTSTLEDSGKKKKKPFVNKDKEDNNKGSNYLENKTASDNKPSTDNKSNVPKNKDNLNADKLNNNKDVNVNKQPDIKEEDDIPKDNIKDKKKKGSYAQPHDKGTNKDKKSIRNKLKEDEGEDIEKSLDKDIEDKEKGSDLKNKDKKQQKSKKQEVNEDDQKNDDQDNKEEDDENQDTNNANMDTHHSTGLISNATNFIKDTLGFKKKSDNDQDIHQDNDQDKNKNDDKNVDDKPLKKKVKDQDQDEENKKNLDYHDNNDKKDQDTTAAKEGFISKFAHKITDTVSFVKDKLIGDFDKELLDDQNTDEITNTNNKDNKIANKNKIINPHTDKIDTTAEHKFEECKNIYCTNKVCNDRCKNAKCNFDECKGCHKDICEGCHMPKCEGCAKFAHQKKDNKIEVESQ